MDKQKNKDLLTAGRKKLEEFQKNKDNKKKGKKPKASTVDPVLDSGQREELVSPPLRAEDSVKVEGSRNNTQDSSYSLQENSNSMDVASEVVEAGDASTCCTNVEENSKGGNADNKSAVTNEGPNESNEIVGVTPVEVEEATEERPGSHNKVDRENSLENYADAAEMLPRDNYMEHGGEAEFSNTNEDLASSAKNDAVSSPSRNESQHAFSQGIEPSELERMESNQDESSNHKQQFQPSLPTDLQEATEMTRIHEDDDNNIAASLNGSETKFSGMEDGQMENQDAKAPSEGAVTGGNMLEINSEEYTRSIIPSEMDEDLSKAEQSENINMLAEDTGLIARMQSQMLGSGEKLPPTSEIQDLRLKLQLESEGKMQLLQSLECIGQKIHQIAKQREGNVTMKTSDDTDAGDIKIDKLVACDGVPGSQSVSSLSVFMNLVEMDVSYIEEQLQNMEAEKLTSLSKIKEATKISDSAETDSIIEPDMYRDLLFDGSSLAHEIDKLAKQTREREAKFAEQVEALSNMLQLAMNERDVLMAKMDDTIALQKSEKENMKKQMEDEVTEIRALLGYMGKDKDASVENAIDSKLEEGQHKSVVQMHLLKEDIQLLLKEKMEVSQKLDHVRVSIENLNQEKELQNEEVIKIKEELDQVKLIAGMKEQLEGEYNNMVEQNNEVLLQLQGLKEQMENILQQKKMLAENVGLKDVKISDLENELSESHLKASVVDKLVNENNALVEQVQQLSLNIEEVENKYAELNSEHTALQHQLQSLIEDSAKSGIKKQVSNEEPAAEVTESQNVEMKGDNELKLREFDTPDPEKSSAVIIEANALPNATVIGQLESSKNITTAKAHLSDAQMTIEKLLKKIQDMMQHVTNSSKGSGRGRANISKLIKTFEPKPHSDDTKDESIQHTDDRPHKYSDIPDAESASGTVSEPGSLHHRLREVGFDIESLKSIMEETVKEVNSIQEQSICESQQKESMLSSLSQLEADLNLVRQAKEIQDSTLSTFRIENEQLVERVKECNSQVESLQAQLEKLTEDTVPKSVMEDQLGDLNKEFMEKRSALEDEISCLKKSMLSAVETIEESVGPLSSGLLVEQHSSPTNACLEAAVNAMKEKLDTLKVLKERLDLCNQEKSEIHKSYEEILQELQATKEQSVASEREMKQAIYKVVKLFGTESMLYEDTEGSCAPSENSRKGQIIEKNTIDIVAELAEEAQKAVEGYSQLKIKLTDLELMLSEKEIYIEALENKCSALTKEVMNIRNCVNCKHFEEKCTALVSQLVDLTEQNDALGVELEAANKTLAEQSQMINASSNVQMEVNCRLDAMTQNINTGVEELIPEEPVAADPTMQNLATDPTMQNLSYLEASMESLIRKYKLLTAQNTASLKSLNDLASEFVGCCGRDGVEMPLDVALREAFSSKQMELTKLQEALNEETSAKSLLEKDNQSLEETQKKLQGDIDTLNAELTKKSVSLEQAEQKLSINREKLSLAVNKGKALIQQRDQLKQLLAERSNELERCQNDLQIRTTALHEAESKIKSYGHAGERIETLEVELAYIRDSTNGLRESLFHKDTILQKIEEILDALDFPEHVQMMEIHEKIEWIVKMHSASTAGFEERGLDYNSPIMLGENDSENSDRQPFRSGNLEDVEAIQKKYEEIQSKYISLAENSDMLEQSLLERNNLLQRLEEALSNIKLPTSVHLLEPEDRIEWLGRELQLAQEYAATVQSEILNFKSSNGLLTAQLEETEIKLSNLELHVATEKQEKELLSGQIEELNNKCEDLTQIQSQLVLDKEDLSNRIKELQSELSNMNAETEEIIKKYVHMIEDVLGGEFIDETSRYTILNLETGLQKLIDEYNALGQQFEMSKEANKQDLHTNIDLSSYVEEVSVLKAALNTKDEELMEMNERLEEAGKQFEISKEADKQGLHSDIDLSCYMEEVSVVKAALDTKDQELMEMNKRLKEAEGLLGSHKREHDSLFEEKQKLSADLETNQKEKEQLQVQLEESEQKLSSTREKLAMAVKRGKGVLQQRDGLKQSLDETTHELEELKKKLNEHEHTILQSENTIRALSSTVEGYKGIEAELTGLKSHTAEAQKSLHDSNESLHDIMTVIGTIEFIQEQQIKDPAEAVRVLAIAYQDLKGKLVSSEEDAKKSKRSLELLAAELDEVQERTDYLEEELGRSKEKAFNIEKEKDLLEETNKDFMDNLQCSMALQTKELECALEVIRKHSTGLQNCLMRLNKVRKEQTALAILLANDFANKMGLIKNITALHHGILSTNSRESKASETLTRLFEEAKQFASQTSNTPTELYSSEHLRVMSGKDTPANGELLNELYGSFEHLIEGCMNDVEIMKEKLKTQSATFSEGVLNVTELVQAALLEAETIKKHQSELQFQEKCAANAMDILSQEKDEAKSRIYELEKQIKVLQADQEASTKRMQEDIKVLEAAQSAKNQEVEELMNALGELDGQTEQLKSKLAVLENDIQQKDTTNKNLEVSRGKLLSKVKELHQLSEGLITEVESFQSKLDSRDVEISRLRQEITRCTNDAVATQEKMKGKVNELDEMQKNLQNIVSKYGLHHASSEDGNNSKTSVLLAALENKITSVISDSENHQVECRNKDALLQDAQIKMQQLSSKVIALEADLKANQIERLQKERSSAVATAGANSDVSEIEEIGQTGIRSTAMMSAAPHVRSTRKVLNDHVGISIDMEADPLNSELEEDDKAKGYVFKSLTTSRIVPKVTRPLADRIDGAWVSCGQMLMKQPTARLGIIFYWIMLHYWTLSFLL